MKTLRNIITVAVSVAALFQTTTVNAQMSNYKFAQQFNRGFALIMEGEYERAESIFANLNEHDKAHGQVGYLLGMIQVKTGNVDANTVAVLENASKVYSYVHQRGRVEDKSSPAKSWFYLAKAYEDQAEYSKAIESYRNYMSCIQMASLDHKREIVSAIKKLREIQTEKPSAQNGLSSELASRQP